jgi:hypothetical protein
MFQMQKTHLVISSVCAVGALALGIVQTFDLVPRQAASPPVAAVQPADTVPGQTVPAQAAASAPSAATITQVAKSDAPVEAVAVKAAAEGQGPDPLRLKFFSGTADNAPLPIDAAALFDGRTDSAVTIEGGNGLDFIVEFGEPGAFTITGLEYTQPAAAAAAGRATSLDVMVIPEGEGTAAGQQVLSFPLSTADGAQSLRIPATAGKGLWLRLAGGPEAGAVALGEIRVETAP